MAITIGLTGSIGSGKSTAANYFAQCGAEIVSGDELGRHAVETQKDIQIAIRERFGNQIFHSTGVIDRSKLGELVFSDLKHVQWLTVLTFPYIHAAWRAAAAACRRSIIVFDAALIFEWGIQNEFDRIVVVAAPPKLVEARAEFGRFSSHSIEQRTRSQIPVERKILGANYVIHNSGSLEDLESQVRALYDTLANQEG
jgi:dephospho-CoA kinase